MVTQIIITVVVTAIWVGLLAFFYWGCERGVEKPRLVGTFGILGLLLAVSGEYYGLFVAPPESAMGDVYRIFYVHVPADWMAFMALSLNFVFSVAFLFKKNWRMDSLAEASAEAGLVFGIMGVCTGSIWARPTWGTWWTWDPRLTTAAVLLIAYGGYLALRRFVDDPEKRGVWSAVWAIFAAVDLPLVWFSVKFWRSIHQTQSTPETIRDPRMQWSLRWNAFAFLFLLIFFVMSRYRISRLARETEMAPPPEALPVGGHA